MAEILEVLSEEEAYLWAILQDRSGLDIAEFTWHDPSAPEGCFRAWPFQWTWWRDESPLQIDQCARALAIDTPVPTPSGWSSMGALHPGDVVYDESGAPTTVLAVSPIWSDRPSFDVLFDDHTSITADADHLWLTWDKTARMARNPNRRGVGRPGVRTTAEIAATLHYGPERNHAIDVAGSLQAPHLELPLDPYYVGLWLGDGSSHSSEVTTADGWVLEELRRRGFAMIPRRAPLLHGVGFPYAHNHMTGSVQAKLRGLGILENKHIPPCYLRASEQHRRDLLAGLVDSDGHIQGNGSCEVVQKRLVIAEGLLELLRSLGEKPRMVKRTAMMSGIDCGPVYRVTWRPRVNPALLPRKANRFRLPGRAPALAQRRVVEVREVASRPVRCITVASPSHLFLAGEGMIPTHNSVGKSLGVKVRGFAFPFQWPGAEMVITGPEGIHVDVITDLIETQARSTRLSREMLAKGQSGVKHKPFHMNFQNGARIMGRIPQRDGRGVKGCTVAGTLVLTQTGYVPVEDLRVGDLVLTHRGRWRPIVQMNEDVNDCYEVRGQGSFPLQVSCDHRFYGVENLASSKQKRRFAPLGFHDVEHLLGDQVYWALPTSVPALPVPAPESFDLTDEFWWLVGRYLADGYLASAWTTGHRRVDWCVPDHKADALTAAMDGVGMGWRRYERGHSSADRFEVISTPLHDWLLDHFGKLAGGKKLPAFVFGMSESYRRSLLDGYLAGDGWFEPTRKRWEVSTASKTLVIGLQLLAQTLGHAVNCTSVQPKTTEIAGVALKATPQVAWRLQIGDGVQVRIDDVMVAKVKSVVPIGKQTVYNPVVEEDHSYITGSVVSHNIHPVQLELDEAQDYPKAGWIELVETLKRGVEGTVWRAHGVTRGVRDKFYEFTQPRSGWKVHNITAMHRPNWTDEEREAKIREYGSREDPDYRRNVLGAHGDATNPIFVLHRLMRGVDTDESSAYNVDEYYRVSVKDTDLEHLQIDIVDYLEFPARHGKYDTVWIGMDVGFTADPSEILVFAEYHPGTAERKADVAAGRAVPEEGMSRLKIIARITLVRMSHPQQVRAILSIIDFYKPRAFSMDKTGNGLPLFQDVQDRIGQAADELGARRARMSAETIKGYNFSEKVLVDIDETVELNEYADTDETVREAGLNRNVLEHSTDVLRKLVDEGRLLLPWDRDLIGEFQGQTFSYSKATMDQYGRRRRIFSEGAFHALDAARMAAMGHAQSAIEGFVSKPADNRPVLDTFIAY